MGQVDSIVFDLGNVLIAWNPRNLYRKIFSSNGDIEYFLNNVCTMEWNHSLDGGRDWEDAIDDKVKEFPQYETAIKAYHQRWGEMISGEVPGTSDLLHKIHKEDCCRLYALTNWAAETWPIAVSRFKFLELFLGTVVSGHEGVCKPEREIFDLICQRYDINPNSTLFIDDSLVNINAATKLGFQVHHFQGAEGLEDRLRSVGVLS